VKLVDSLQIIKVILEIQEMSTIPTRLRWELFTIASSPNSVYSNLGVDQEKTEEKDERKKK
jgi:hypothetical protein